MKFRTSFGTGGADAEDLRTKELVQRHWHLASVGLGNCRAAQALKREIDRRIALNLQPPTHAPVATSGTGVSPISSTIRAGEAARAIKDLIERDWHFTSVGLGNCRAAQANRRQLNEQLLIQSAAVANADFNPQERRDSSGQWTSGGDSTASATNSPPRTPRPTAGNANTSDDDTDDIPLTYGGAHAKLRQSQSDASAQLYNKSGGEMKAVAAGGRAAAEMNPIVAFFHGIYQALAGKDAIDSNKKLTPGERWKSAGSAAMAAAPTVLKAGNVAKAVVETDEAVQGIKKAESAIAETEKAAQGIKRADEAGAGAAKAAEDSAALRPYGGPGGGHHVPAKSAFTGNPAYDINKALAIPNAELARLSADHQVISTTQQILYRAVAKTGRQLTWDAVENIETEALVRGGIKSEMTARAAVKQAISALKASGVSAPTRIPWGK